MIILASDLDNTLVFSPRRDIVGDKVCVEVYKNQENSYMTKKSINLLKTIQEKAMFIPVTTRSSEGYSRIDFNSVGVDIPKYALTCNGGVLLVDGKRDESWYSNTLELIEPSSNALDKAVEILEKDGNLSLDIRKVEGVFIFTKSNNIDETVRVLKSELAEELELDLIRILTQGVKIYIIPTILNKGTGIKRLREMFAPSKMFVAGDTVFDIPMLILGDKSYFPEVIERDIFDNHKLDSYMCVVKSQGDFSDVFLNDILECME